LRLRVLVGAAGTPRLVSGDPLDVLENGVIGARWVVADASEDDQQNEGRAELLRALQARAGTPARSLQQVLVRLPRRLSGPRLHGGPLSIGAWQHVQIRCEERGNAGGWAEAIRWLRGILPTPPERLSSERNARAAELWSPLYSCACPGRDSADDLARLLAALDAPPPGQLGWDGWLAPTMAATKPGQLYAFVWGRKARKHVGKPLTVDPSYARWVCGLPSEPTGVDGEAWCSPRTREIIGQAIK